MVQPTEASLMVKGTKTGFFTDMDGNFELSGIDYPAILVVSYIGFAEREVNVNGTETDLTISLSNDQNLLDDRVGCAEKRSSQYGSAG